MSQPRLGWTLALLLFAVCATAQADPILQFDATADNQNAELGELAVLVPPDSVSQTFTSTLGKVDAIVIWISEINNPVPAEVPSFDLSLSVIDSNSTPVDSVDVYTGLGVGDEGFYHFDFADTVTVNTSSSFTVSASSSDFIFVTVAGSTSNPYPGGIASTSSNDDLWFRIGTHTYDPAFPAPEPSSTVLLLTAVAGAGLLRRRFRKKPLTEAETSV